MKRPAGCSPQSLIKRLIAGVNASQSRGSADDSLLRVVERNIRLIDNRQWPLNAALVSLSRQTPARLSSQAHRRNLHVLLGNVVNSSRQPRTRKRSQQQIDRLPWAYKIELL